jgi:predicted Zn-dependent protease
MIEVILVALFAAALFAAGCRAPAPAPAKPPLIKLSAEQKIKVTQEGAAAFESACGGLFPDANLQKYVEGVGAKLVITIPENHPRNFPFSFRVLNAKTVNAFATPGGYIYVTRGLLAILDNEDELAAVLAHQMAHVTMGHFDKNASALLTLNVGLEKPAPAEAVAEQCPGPLSLPDGTVLARNLREFGFSGEDEAEADAIAMQYVARTTKYDPRAVVDVEGMLDSLQSPPVAEMRSWRHTHPGPSDRKRRMEDILTAKYPEVVLAAKPFVPLDAAVAKMTGTKPCFDLFDRAEKQRDLGERMLRCGFPKNAKERLEYASALYDKAMARAKESGLVIAGFYSARALALYDMFQSAPDEQYRNRAREDFDDAKRIDGDNFVARLFRGYFFLAVDKFYKKAEEELLEAARLDGGGEHGGLAYFYLANLYDNAAFEGRSEQKAAHYYEIYLALEPLGAEAPKAAERLGALKPDSAILRLLEQRP